MIEVTRYHDISMGHRVVGHEGKCQNLHGHNYRIYFTVTGEQMDKQGRLIDFGVIKSKLCQWIEDNWDHKMLLWEKDEYVGVLASAGHDGTKTVPFNPTAENIAIYLVDVIGPIQLCDTGCVLVECTVEETRKCSAKYTVSFEDAQAWAEAEKIRQMNMRNETPPIDYLDLPF